MSASAEPPSKRSRTAGNDPDGVVLEARASHACASLDGLAELWRGQNLCDVKIRVDTGETFDAHKVVLACNSDFFKALFTSGMRDGHSSVVAVCEVSAETLADVLTFMYERQFRAKPSTLAAVMRAASRLEIKSLLEVSADFLLSTLTPETCVASWNVADSIARPELEQLRVKCCEYALTHFDTVSALPSFGSLPRAQLASLLASDELVAKEEVVFEALERWLAKCDPPLDAPAQLELRSLVRYPFLDTQYLAGHVEPKLRATEGGMPLLYEAFRHNSVPAHLRESSPRTRPRRPIVPVGIQLQLSADFLSRWTCHFDHPYDHPTTVEEIESVPAQATHVFVGARRPTGSILGACGRREEVLRRTTSRSRAHEHNGAFWYFVVEAEAGDVDSDEEEGEPLSFGFSRVESIELNTADATDTRDGEDGHYRLSWHIAGESGGYRAGNDIELHEKDEASGWRMLMYWLVL